MYDLFYNVLKENYGDDDNLVYMDTDSFLLEFKNVDVYKYNKSNNIFYFVNKNLHIKIHKKSE